ncbi:hypothetical protein Ancab_005879, partial [Ancistrocladus abbreviatus]
YSGLECVWETHFHAPVPADRTTEDYREEWITENGLDMSEAIDDGVSNSNKNTSKSVHAVTLSKHWSPLDEGTFKLNFDATSSSGGTNGMGLLSCEIHKEESWSVEQSEKAWSMRLP